MSEYHEIESFRAPKMEKGTNFVEISLMDCMDNQSKLVIQKTESGKMPRVSHSNNHCSLAFSNMQCTCDSIDIAGAFEDEDLQAIVNMLNTGVVKVTALKQKEVK